MQLGYVGLGKMGYNMVERLLEKRYEVVVFDKNKEAVEKIAAQGADVAASLQELAAKLETPRFVWLMVPHQVVDDVLDEIKPYLEKGDTIIDGGNSPYKESMRRAAELKERGIQFIDVGVSGGPGGARDGACLMIGGEKSEYEKLEKLWKDLAAPDAYGYMGRFGAGHFVKMVHNAIEYGMMQSLAEGFSILKNSEFDLNMQEIARVYNNRSVIESRLVGWLKTAYEKYGLELEAASGTVSQSGEAEWTVEAAKELTIQIPIIEGALNFRLQSEKNPTYTGKILNMLRNQFGGHNIQNSKIQNPNKSQ